MGRYIFRIDEIIQPAGCVEGVYRKFLFPPRFLQSLHYDLSDKGSCNSGVWCQVNWLTKMNLTEGVAYAAPSGGSMLGGDMVNVTGPCFLPNSQIRCKFGQYETQGTYINPVQAKCPTPSMFEAGWREFGVSVDGGRTYNFRGEFFVGQQNTIIFSYQYT